MALVLDDRVKETSTTTGTGTFDLDGAVSNFQTFVAGVGNSNTTYYAIVNRDAAEWEVGIGTVTDAAPDTLARTSVLASSNADSAVNFSAGTKDVFCTLPASKTILDADTFVLLDTQTASGSAPIEFVTGIDATYSEYIFAFEKLIPDADNNIHMLISDDGGSTFESTSYDYHTAILKANSGSYSSSSGVNQSQLVLATSIGTATGENIAGEVHLYNPADSGVRTLIRWEIVFKDLGANLGITVGGGARDVNSVVSAVQFLPAGGNFESGGKIRMYGRIAP